MIPVTTHIIWNKLQHYIGYIALLGAKLHYVNI